MPTTNTPQARQQGITQLFDLVASGYDNPSQRFFPFAADYMTQRLPLKAGDRVLDIATGTGIAAIAAAQRILPGGRVQAIDLSENMLAKADFNRNKMALDNIDLHLMDAATPEFRHNYFDAALCAFGLFFLEDMSAALQRWLRLLKPEGNLIITSFAPAAFGRPRDLFLHRLEQFGVTPPPLNWARLAGEDTCRNLFDAAGFIHTEVETRQMGYHLGKAEDWWEIVWNTGFRGLLTSLTETQRDTFKQAHLAEVAALATDDGIWLDVDTHFTLGQRPTP